jgi:thermitase
VTPSSAKRTGTMAARIVPYRPSPAGLSGVMIVLALLLCLLWPNPAIAQEVDDDAAAVGDGFVQGELVVKLQPSATIGEVYDEYPQVDGRRTEAFLDSSKIYLLRLVPGADTEQVRADMRGDSTRFIYAEFNYTVDSPEGDPRSRARSDYLPEPSTDAAPYSGQYAVGAARIVCGQDIGGGAGTTVAVLDTGVQRDHPALQDSLVAGYDFVDDDADPSEEANGIDDDGDAYVDEMVGHGTHVAGIVHLTAPQAEIMPLRVLDSDGIGNTFIIAEAIRRAVDPDGDPATDDGADVINMSLGSSQRSSLIHDVTEDLEADDDDDDEGEDDEDDTEGAALDPVSVPVEGVVVVASAGNEGVSEKRYPAAEASVLAVASVGEDERRSEFSNYGGWIDVAAPGDDIYSTFTPDAQGNPRYAQWDGTSMAAPFVAGQAALIRGLEPELPSVMWPGETNPVPADKRSVESVLKETARPLAASLGAGHVDAFAGLKQLRPNNATTCAAPKVSGTRPTAGATLKDRTPLIRATVTDRETDLTASDIQLSLDGQAVSGFAYDSGALTFDGARRLSYGAHTVELTTEDADGLQTTKSWRFKVAKRR